MKARPFATLLLACLLVSVAGGTHPAHVQAAGMPSVRFSTNQEQMWVDGESRSIDVAPVIVNDRMYVPLRHLASALGAGIDYIAAEGKVTLTLGETTIELWVDQATARVNGQARHIDPANDRVVPIIRANRTMLPLRFVAESLGAEVKWHPEDGTVALAPQGVPDEVPVRTGWYRVAGTVRDARTNAAVAGVQVVARTHVETSASDLGTVAAAAPAVAPASAPAVAAPAPAAPGAPVTAGGVQRGSPPRAFGAPGQPEAATDPPASGGGAPGSRGEGATPPAYEFKTETGENGAFQLDLPAGAAHRVSLTKTCFATQEFLVSSSIRRDVSFESSTPPFTTPLAAGTYRVYGQVKDQDGRPIAGACVAATPPVGSASPAGPTRTAVTTYVTDETGNYFVDWPAWKAIKVKATAPDCDGKGVALVWTGSQRPATGEGGPRFMGPSPYNPEPDPEYLDIPANPLVAKDVSAICVPPPSDLPLAVTIGAGATGTTVCQQSAGTDPGFVRMTLSASAITTGQSVDVTASPVGDPPKPTLLRWWLNDPKAGTLYASGCKATYVAPASLGLAYQTSAYVLVAKEGERKPSSGGGTGGGNGSSRIMIYDARNGPGGQAAGCTTATYSVTAHGKHGDITRLDIQGIGTWRSAGAGTLTVTGVPVGRYTIWVTTTGTGTHTLQVQVGCPVTRSYID